MLCACFASGDQRRHVRCGSFGRLSTVPTECPQSYLWVTCQLPEPLMTFTRITAPVYLQLLPPATPPTADILNFLDLLAQRLGMLKRGGERDIGRAAVWFVKWWREEGGIASASAPDTSSLPAYCGLPLRAGWGFDFEWSVNPGEVVSVQEKMEECVDSFLISEAEEEREVSSTQVRKNMWKEKVAKRRAKSDKRAGR